MMILCCFFLICVDILFEIENANNISKWLFFITSLTTYFTIIPPFPAFQCQYFVTYLSLQAPPSPSFPSPTTAPLLAACPTVSANGMGEVTWVGEGPLCGGGIGGEGGHVGRRWPVEDEEAVKLVTRVVTPAFYWVARTT